MQNFAPFGYEVQRITRDEVKWSLKYWSSKQTDNITFLFL